MFRKSTQSNFFTLPSLAFFDASKIHVKHRVHLTPGTFSDMLCQTMKPDWRVLPQTKPASASTFLFVNKDNKVTGRLRPPLCVPLPRAMQDGGLSRDQVLDFHAANDGTWLLVCTQRGVGMAIVNKNGIIEDGTMRAFSLLVKNTNETHMRGKEEYDDPGFIRPGSESPLFAEVFSWISERLPHLEQCSNWVARRDDPDNTTWTQLKRVMRETEQESRFERHNAAVADEEAMIGASSNSSSSSSSSSGGEDASASTTTPTTMRKYSKPYDENADMFGGHGVWTPEGAAAASQFAVERRAILDHSRWVIVPPSVMPMMELKDKRRPDDVNVMAAVGRLRHGVIELL